MKKTNDDPKVKLTEEDEKRGWTEVVEGRNR